ncbi:DUF5691 domain-containing protein [Streptomyces noursei]|nr:DUF5691 domain-containing protein [Streptomyces noursei]
MRRRSALRPAPAAERPAPAPADPRPRCRRPPGAGSRCCSPTAPPAPAAGAAPIPTSPSCCPSGWPPPTDAVTAPRGTAARTAGRRPVPHRPTARRARPGGPRGLWLARLNDDWRFALRGIGGPLSLPGADAPEAVRRLWEEGCSRSGSRC